MVKARRIAWSKKVASLGKAWASLKKNMVTSYNTYMALQVKDRKARHARRVADRKKQAARSAKIAAANKISDAKLVKDRKARAVKRAAARLADRARWAAYDKAQRVKEAA